MSPEISSSSDQLVQLFKALADPNRLRIVGLLVERKRCGQELASALRISPATISHHLRVLREAGLLRESRQRPYTFYKLDLKVLHKAMTTVTDRKAVQQFAAEGSLSEEERKVLGTFFEGSTLRAIPVQRKKKEIVFEEILRRLPRRKTYTERELSRFIETIHPDYATIRREFIMGMYMEREGGGGLYRLADRGRAVLEGR